MFILIGFLRCLAALVDFMQTAMNTKIEVAAKDQIKEDRELLTGVASTLSPTKCQTVSPRMASMQSPPRGKSIDRPNYDLKSSINMSSIAY